jgi:hypothetical protein
MVRRHFLVGLFLLCMCVLMMQIIETRILSVVSYYHLAFFAISMAMFGMTGGSLYVYFRPSWFTADRLLENLVWTASAFGLAVFVSALLLISTVIIGPMDIQQLPMVALVWLKLILILAAPYFFAGMAISLALTRSPWPVSLVYGTDLIGAATGCLATLAVLSVMDAVSALLLVGGIGAVSAIFFAAARTASGQNDAPALAVARWRLLSRPVMLAAFLVDLALINVVAQPSGMVLSLVKDNLERPTPDSLIRWNSFSRVNVGRSEFGTPQMWAASPEMPETGVYQRNMQIDGSAASSMYYFQGDLSAVDFLKYDITNLAYSIRHDGRAAIIGVGGGRDILSALLFGFHDVTGVELNPIFVNLLTHGLAGYNKLAAMPGVRLIVDEARSWFSRSTDRFDLIEMSLIDTWAATGAGAFSLSENGLYTIEGWRTFFDHLTPTGIFTVSRWYAPTNVDETGRVMSLAVASLFGEGVEDPRQHLFLVARDSLSTLIVSRRPFTAEELATLTATAARLKFQVIVSPLAPVTSAVLSQIVDARSAEEASEAATRLSASSHLDLTAPTDDRPFFFNQLRFADPKSLWYALVSAIGVTRGNLLATITLTIIVVWSALLVILTAVVPALPSLSRVPPRLAAFGTAYFLLIGLAFMFVEIGLIERISVFLGHPVYGLAIGLFGIIVSTGAGSLLVGYLRLVDGARLLAWVGMLGLYLILLPFWFPTLTEAFQSDGIVVRAAVALSATVPSGVLMGFGFPTGMELVNAIDRRATPWFWAVNGAAGVLAAGLAVALSIAFSISVTLWVGAGCYLLLGPVAVMLARPRRRERAAAAVS